MNLALQIGQLLTHILGVITLGLAISGVNAWRRQVLGTRKIQLAEQCLALFYEARDSFLWIRSRGIFSDELEAIDRMPDESVEAFETRRTPMVVMHRLSKSMEVFSKIEARRYEFAAVFGADAIAPFKSMKSAVSGLIATAHTLIDAQKTIAALRDARTPTVQNAREVADLRSSLWGADDASDDVSKAIAGAVAAIEQSCRPVLEQTTKKSFWSR